ncbi:ribosome assembly cofactor RimP [Aquimarina agarilytica]|uniref:ribosome assembly cofactor RimP n=1 Tax=Aquimarina agarilytica TaxID=1087449 RepID=UPI00028975F5|nr:ribosome assembly cofactor RimP [Aquimarina agarilytica]
MFKQKVESLLEEALVERSNLFLISFQITGANIIQVILDGDEGVSVDDCIEISRAIEHNLDREEEDFSLQVMSAGITEGLVHIRQYPKNIGRTLNVVTEKEEIEGELIATTADDFTLQWKAREPKPVGKGKVTVQKTKVIPYGEVKKAHVVVKFN